MNGEQLDHELSKTLQEWRVNAALPPRFQEGVWRRIEQEAPLARTSAWTIVSNWIATVLPRPAMAAAYVALLLAVGVTAGWTRANFENAHVKNELGNRYVATLDPYFTSHH